MSEPSGSPKRFVIYRGTQMIEGWPEKIIEAQNVTHYDIGGEDFERVRYGNELDDWGANERPCHDCRVIKGEYHVVSCDVERCPKCGGQAISCDCLDEVDDDSTVGAEEQSLNAFSLLQSCGSPPSGTSR